MEQRWQAGEPLPRAAQAEIDLRKFTEYSMNPSNPNNKGKWQAFKVLGYDIEGSQSRQIAAQAIMAHVRLQLNQISATLDDPSPYGIRFSVKIPIVGLNGIRGILVTKWQIDNNKSIPRLITNWVNIIQ